MIIGSWQVANDGFIESMVDSYTKLYYTWHPEDEILKRTTLYLQETQRDQRGLNPGLPGGGLTGKFQGVQRFRCHGLLLG